MSNEELPNDETVDDSEDMDLVTVFESAGTSAEMEALAVQGLLESNGIHAVFVGDTRLPNFPETVKVPQEEVEQARQLIADALAAGPAAAQEAEAAGERGETAT